MKLLTPVEYADAYRYLEQQHTRAHAAKRLTDLIEPHVVRIQAETVRRRAAADEWLDRSALIAARRHELIEADNDHRARKAASA